MLLHDRSHFTSHHRQFHPLPFAIDSTRVSYGDLDPRVLGTDNNPVAMPEPRSWFNGWLMVCGSARERRTLSCSYLALLACLRRLQFSIFLLQGRRCIDYYAFTPCADQLRRLSRLVACGLHTSNRLFPSRIVDLPQLCNTSNHPYGECDKTP